MVDLPGYLRQRRQGYEAVVEVPPSKRAAVGRKRLTMGLDTRDPHVAKARLRRALVELHRRIDERLRASPQTDLVTAEALAWREQMEAVRQGDTRGLPVVPVETPDGTVEYVPDAGLLVDVITERGATIARDQGPGRAEMFADLTFGRATPLLLHRDTWLSEPGKKGKRRERTNMEFRGIADAFAAWLARERLPGTVEAVSRAVAGRYLGHLHAIGRSPKRVRDVASALSGYWQWLARRGHISDGVNPWKGQEVGVVKAGGEWADEGARPLTDDELRTLLDGTDDAVMGDMMRVLALTGMRIDEAARLRVRDCMDGTFRVQTEGRGKTPAATRAVPVHPDLAAIVERRTKDKAADAWLFHELGEPDRYGRRSPTLDARLNRYRRELGVHDQPEGAKRSRVTVHSFRRWFITKALRAGQPERVVKQVVGHKLPKADVTLGVYFEGDLPAAFRACVEAVLLPAPREETQESASHLES